MMAKMTNLSMGKHEQIIAPILLVLWIPKFADMFI